MVLVGVYYKLLQFRWCVVIIRCKLAQHHRKAQGWLNVCLNWNCFDCVHLGDRELIVVHLWPCNPLVGQRPSLLPTHHGSFRPIHDHLPDNDLLPSGHVWGGDGMANTSGLQSKGWGLSATVKYLIY